MCPHLAQPRPVDPPLDARRWFRKDGRLRVELDTSGHGHATGTLDRRRVDLDFGFGS
jgi:hypothetical protein